MNNNCISLLTGDLGRAVYEGYKQLFDTRLNDNMRFGLAIDDKGTIEGCGSLSLCLIEEVLRTYGFRTLNLYDFGALTSLDMSVSKELAGMHINFGLVLVKSNRFNFSREKLFYRGTRRIGQNLQQQLEDAGCDISIPVYIPFNSLEAAADSGSPFGARFRLLDANHIQNSAEYLGEDSMQELSSAIVHVRKAEGPGLYDFKFYFNTPSLVPISEINKPHQSEKPYHTIMIQKFEKDSSDYGRVLIVPLDYNSNSERALTI